MKQIICSFFLLLLFIDPTAAQRIQPAAERFNAYLPLLKGRRIAIFANQTTVVFNQTHLVDTLSKMGINIKKIFAPEHGFRGKADAGEKLDNAIDAATGIPVISLYGKKRKASAADLADIDVLVFDIQDVGCRFYTFISSLQEFIETAVAAKLPLLILDRPNPNGFYVDGPVLEKPFRSFVGMQPVPVVYGLTIGEYAKMLIGEKWLDSAVLNALPGFKLTVITCNNYTHKSRYALPVKPSPNLPDMQSVYWYPSTCFFEGTILSEGRGTDFPFQIFGHPALPNNLYAFTPTAREGAKAPKLRDQLCYGWNISTISPFAGNNKQPTLQIDYLLQAYALFPQKDSFFLGNAGAPPSGYFFNKLAGNATLMAQVKSGATATVIRQSWLAALKKFKTIRKKYLCYPDFE
jgi:uncharacterized protein YbbC (DUF1343 family)